MHAVSIDPELSRQLDHAGSGEPVCASFSLNPGSPHAVFSPEETERRVLYLLDKVSLEAGTRPAYIRIHRNIGSFSLTAPAGFVRKLIDQDDVISATASANPECTLIEPVASEPWEIPARKDPGAARDENEQ
jgi:hypothetical protein